MSTQDILRYRLETTFPIEEMCPMCGCIADEGYTTSRWENFHEPSQCTLLRISFTCERCSSHGEVEIFI